MDYKSGIVHLSSSDGILLEIPESKLSSEDLTYIRSLDVCAKAWRRAIASIHHFLRRRLSFTLPCFHPSSELQSRAPETIPLPPTIPTTQLESWEADLVAFFRECRPRIEGGSKTGKTFVDYFRPLGPGADDDPERKNARRFADRLDLVRHLVGA